MNYHTKIFFLSTTCLVVSGMLLILWKYIDLFGIFLHGKGAVINLEVVWTNAILFSVLFFAIFLSLLPLFFFKESVYGVWKNFVIVAAPALLVLVFTTPESSGGFFGSTSLFDRGQMAWYGSILFLILSYIIIAVQAWKTRKK